MGAEPINRLYGRRSLSALLVALAMLVVVTAGSASAETAARAQSLENERLTEDTIKKIESDYVLGEALLSETSLDNLSFDEVEELGDAGNNIVVLVWTNGEDAWVVVVIIQDDGSYDIHKVGRMSVEDLRERLTNFDGRVIVRHIGGDSNESLCARGHLAARWSVNQTAADATLFGQFRGVWMDAEGFIGGDIMGSFANGNFSGQATNLDGDVIGILEGNYYDGNYRGIWQLSDGTADGVLKGKYKSTSEDQGVMKGKWKENCQDNPGIEPAPSGPNHIDCRNQTSDAEDSRCKVKPKPSGDGEEMKPKPKPSDDGVDQIKKGAEDILDTKLVETDGGVSVDIGDAAAGGAITSIPMLGLGLLRRRFLL